jgi:hypothetical protein
MVYHLPSILSCASDVIQIALQARREADLGEVIESDVWAPGRLSPAPGSISIGPDHENEWWISESKYFNFSLLTNY